MKRRGEMGYQTSKDALYATVYNSVAV
jgi:hypothetical protein